MYKDGFIDEFPNGARGESRTPMTLRSIDLESIASANSATRANLRNLTIFPLLFQLRKASQLRVYDQVVHLKNSARSIKLII